MYTVDRLAILLIGFNSWELVPYLDDDGSELSNQANSAETKVTKKGSKSQPPAVVDRFLIDCFPVK